MTPKAAGPVALVLDLKDGGTISGVSCAGRLAPFFFSDTRCIANANCSTFSLPVFFISHNDLLRFKKKKKKKKKKNTGSVKRIIKHKNKKTCNK